ncbi:LacI family DNA-binding transcriptional regulator [Conexibacter sp. CPCC 206217]|uniref:LacI family DNA-binding transcriptional regulator n=1 Tax=Conexibacter sp. CPCC 206217 TaxID=3064574 RepID=UPI002715CA7D|nr:LacI family DNA-binding transcriptional regulator [Conexibacter sp. CPCC 206217]MDO8212489.1 LacI family DNA-binding transcriptional regulator [Conexibacter sp. CPCC 206217]
MPRDRSRTPEPRTAPVTLREVAAEAGVHTGTASRALNDSTRGFVNAATAERVMRAAARLGYRPNSIARGLKTNRSYIVGVVVPDLRNPLFPPIARGIEERLEPGGYTALLANTDNDPEHERTSFEALQARQVDGYITATARRDHPLLREIARGWPLVLVNRVVDGHDISAVVADDRDGMRQAVEHLRELGHTRIAHVGGSAEISTGTERLGGYEDAMAAAGLPVDPALVAIGGMYAEAEGARMTRQLLGAGVRFTAIAAGNDLIALGAIDALREAGLRVPEDVSVVGFNDMAWSERFSPPLTTVRVPHHELGMEAGSLLLERLANPSAPSREIVLPVRLIVRGSTAPVPVARVSGARASAARAARRSTARAARRARAARSTPAANGASAARAAAPTGARSARAAARPVRRTSGSRRRNPAAGTP